jgi:predicted dehydrogenase/serine acetyltransferase
MSTPQFILIGCGHVAQRHLEQIQLHGQLAAVCDVNEEKGRATAERYGVPFYPNTHSLFQSAPKADIVVICTPNADHAAQAIEAMQAGYHVIVEKPMALSSGDALAICSASLRYQKKVFTVLQNRFNPAIQQLKQALTKGELGTPYSIQLTCFWHRDAAYYTGSEWKGKKEKDGGALYTQCSHFIDLACWLLGPVVQSNAWLNNAARKAGNEGEDTGIISLLFANGATGSLHYSTNSYGKNMEGSLTLLAEKGSIKIGGPYLDQITYQHTEQPLPAITDTIPALQSLYDAVIQTLDQGKPHYAPPESLVESISLIEALYRNAYDTSSPGQVQRIGIRNVKLGEGVRIMDPVNLYGCSIGEHCFIGPFVEIQENVHIGSYCKIQSHSFICSLVTMGDHCFIGHGVMFVNDTFSDGGPAGGDQSKWKATHIGHHVSIGSNATILPVHICDHVVIGAGSVVTKNITEPGTYAGNPARKI